MRNKVNVMAGTPVDTRMGADYLRAKDPSLEIVPYNVSPDPMTQTVWQYGSDESKRERMIEVFDGLQAQGMQDYFIYCNSLAGAFDFDSFAVERGVRIVTPLQVYRNLAHRYSCIAFNAANLLSAYAIDKVLKEANLDLDVIGMGHLAIVKDIEAGYSPEEIIERQGLVQLADFFKASGAQAWILGCTHFPYVKEALEQRIDLPIIDPADEMYELLIQGMQE